jgi:hypothetical protein
MARYQATHRERLKAKDIEAFRRRERSFNLKGKYGITLIEYEAMVEKQNGVCAICKKPPTAGRGRRLMVDHDHQTGRIRGLLCHGCNNGLGDFCESADILRAAIEYVTANTDTFSIN